MENNETIPQGEESGNEMSGIKKIFMSLAPSDDPRRERFRTIGFRVLTVITVTLAMYYLLWRYFRSLNPEHPVFSIVLVLAETYGIIGGFLFIMMAWRPIRRTPPNPPEDATVDVFITTVNEPVELVEKTIWAAVRIDWTQKRVCLLDDGNRTEMRETAAKYGCTYISRGSEWAKKPRHAKAGNVNNAVLMTSGEFILILDADQIPSPKILRRTLGYFRDPQVAFVQTPQEFYNLLPGDPFGNDAPLFYGPILQGKDGWNAAFFCGSNGVLRREALMMLGLMDYVESSEAQMKKGLRKLRDEVKRLKRTKAVPKATIALLTSRLKEAERDLESSRPLELVADKIKKTVDEANRHAALGNLDVITEILQEFAGKGDSAAAETEEYLRSGKDWILEELDKEKTDSTIPETTIEDFNLTRSDEAIPIHVMSTNSVTEDMATALRLHSLGWKSVFHKETLAYGLAPEDLDTAIKQRFRWAQGTLQVFFRDNPLFKKGLSAPQRLMYFATMYSYFNGFFNLVLLLAPPLYFLTGMQPVVSWSYEFLWHLFPYFIFNKLLFRYLAWGISVRRGEQYDVALFPVNIRAVFSALFRKRLKFVVTAKHRQKSDPIRLIWPQILLAAITVVSVFYGVYAYATDRGISLIGLVINGGWGFYNLYLLSVIFKAAWYEPPADWRPKTPKGLRRNR